jgi:hypothetical protein
MIRQPPQNEKKIVPFQGFSKVGRISQISPPTADRRPSRWRRIAVGGQKITKPHFIGDFGKILFAS